MPLSRDQILQADDLPTREVDVPEWGGSVLVRGLTGEERAEYEMSMIRMIGPAVEVKMKFARERMVALGCVDEQGKRLFTDKDVEALAKKNGAALERVYAAIQELSGLSSEDAKELTANFTGIPAGVSISI